MDVHRLGGPLRAFRDRYVAYFGGLSYDLAPGSVGVDPAHLAQAPGLTGRVVLASAEHRSPGLVEPRATFEVVALTHQMKNAREDASGGGVVFSTFDLEAPEASPLLQTLSTGDTVVLNSAIERLRSGFIRRPDFGA